MKKIFFLAISLLVITSQMQATTPYVPVAIRNADSTNIDAIKTDKACDDGCDEGCNNGETKSPLTQPTYINLNEKTQEPKQA